jgi:tetratricopeptide (TPR) repeat protein
MTTPPSDAGLGLTPELEEAIRRGYAQRDRANMGPTIAYFESLLAEHPGHPVLVYEVAGAYDTAGQEEKARELYERALDLGLAGDTLRRCLCQYGSTLRWLGQYNTSLAALDRAKKQWPESDAVRVFRALTLNDAGRSDEAVAELMTVITSHAEVTDLGRWADGLRGLAQWLADGRPDNLLAHELESGGSARGGAGSRSGAGQAADEANPVAVPAVIAGGNRDAVDLGVAWLQLETHPLVKRDRAAVHRRGDRADHDGAASPGSLEERLIQQAAEPVAPLGRIHPDKVNIGLARPGLRDEPGQEPGEPAVAFGGEAGVSEVLEK